MKFLLRSVVVLLLTISFGCQDHENVTKDNIVNLNFEVDRANGGTMVVTVDDVKLTYGNLQSNQLREVWAKNKVTGEKVRGFVLALLPSGAAGRVNLAHTIERGYFLNGSCFEYGTMYTDNDGESMFIPASNTTKLMGYPDICPPADSEYV